MNNISKEDYLSVIYKYQDSEGEIKPAVIAEMLDITQAAVTDMLKKLSKARLVNYEKYKGISLTAKGNEYARSMVRRHRIWEVYLYKVIGLPWNKVHEEAHRLEHSSSDELINRLEEILDFPEYDPHGDPIPSRQGKMPKIKKHVPLANLNAGESGIVIRVNDFDDNFLSYISQLGIALNEKITVKERRSFDNSLLLNIKGQPFNVSNDLAENVFVEVIKKRVLHG